MRKQFFTALGFAASSFICASADATGMRPTEVQVGECVPSYIYITSPVSRSTSRSSAGSNHGITGKRAGTHIAFFASDCNSEDTYFIALNGVQYALKTEDHQTHLASTYPTGTYVGDDIKVVIRRGKLVSRTFDGPGSSDILNEEYKTTVGITLKAKTGLVHGIYRSGP